MPVIEQLDIRDDEVRIIAALHAQRRLAEEAAERLIALLDELDAPNEDLEDGADDEPPLSLGYGGAGDRCIKMMIVQFATKLHLAPDRALRLSSRFRSSFRVAIG